jgi:non-specific serine/threonine protein kinase/serine/threonine-protein kinase
VQPERWQRLKEIFVEAQELGKPERERFLDRACADDAELRAELASLLAVDRDAASFLETPAAAAAAPDLEDAQAAPVGRRFGRYRVLSEIGRGGMGVVYRAVRDDDTYHQEVALKLLHRGLGGLESEFFESRFRRERQILASLEHPNIARLIDGGADDDGRSFCVMELVDGVPIDVYCQEHRLDLIARLELVRTACSAVAFAHGRLVVHCDLKPANVLVTEDGTLKLLDFGIAKLLAPDSAEAGSAVTASGWAMTPEYASPEQVRRQPVTTATDVYALGVMLYELLTGCKPYQLGTHGPEDVVRASCEQEVVRPSQAVVRPRSAAPGTSSLAASPAGPPDNRPNRLRRRLAGDLDTIVLRALAKDPQRRYGSVVQLSDDLRRHLTGMPIRARPDRLSYRAGKFVGRHRAAVAATVLAVFSLCGGLAATLQQARVAHVQRAAAERRFGEVRSLARTFIFEIHDAVAPLPGSTPVRARIIEVGLQYLERLEREAVDDVSLQVELAAAYERIAAVQGGVGVANLGDREGAIRSQRRTLALREAISRALPDDLDAELALASTRGTLGDLLWEAGDAEGRRREYAAAFAIRSSAADRAPDNLAVRRAVASSLWDTSQLSVDDGDLEAGRTGFERTLVEYRAIAAAPGAADADRRNLALAAKKVGAVRSVSGDLEGALASLEAALAIDRDRLATNPGRTETMLDVSFDHSDLGFVLVRLGRPGEAVGHYEQAVGLRRTVSEADPEDARARTALQSGRTRLGDALAAAAEDPGTPCADVQGLLERAFALSAEAAADGTLSAEARATHEARLRAAGVRCVKS